MQIHHCTRELVFFIFFFFVNLFIAYITLQIHVANFKSLQLQHSTNNNLQLDTVLDYAYPYRISLGGTTKWSDMVKSIA